MLHKKIWRFLLKRYKNSKFQVAISRFLETLKFEGFYISYSQFGEDLIIENFLRNFKNGFYVDIGCNRPIEGNNTFKFYLKGWRGINIDGNPKMIASFNKIRKKDINLCEIVSCNKNETEFFISNDDRVSSLKSSFIDSNDKTRFHEKTERVYPKSLEEILDKHLPENKEITLMNIDVEGHDLEVLISNNFNKHNPILICIEDHDFRTSEINENKICEFILPKGYFLAGYSKPNLFFIKNGYDKIQ